jgi:DNA-binding transcriptional MocR family regulator
MKRSEAWKALSESGSWMHVSERVTFYALLERSDNADCTVPDFMTPGLDTLAKMTCCSKGLVVRALNHLELHGWLSRKRGGGRGVKTAYQLASGGTCPETCGQRRAIRQAPKTVRPPNSKSPNTVRPPNSQTVQTATQNGRSDPEPDVGLRRGRVKEGSALPPDWSLIKQIVRIVNDDPCGGIHRDELAEKLHMPPGSKALGQALAIATRRGQIDWCGRYAVKVIPKEKWPT